MRGVVSVLTKRLHSYRSLNGSPTDNIEIELSDSHYMSLCNLISPQTVVLNLMLRILGKSMCFFLPAHHYFKERLFSSSFSYLFLRIEHCEEFTHRIVFKCYF